MNQRSMAAVLTQYGVGAGIRHCSPSETWAEAVDTLWNRCERQPAEQRPLRHSFHDSQHVLNSAHVRLHSVLSRTRSEFGVLRDKPVEERERLARWWWTYANNLMIEHKINQNMIHVTAVSPALPLSSRPLSLHVFAIISCFLILQSPCSLPFLCPTWSEIAKGTERERSAGAQSAIKKANTAPRAGALDFLQRVRARLGAFSCFETWQTRSMSASHSICIVWSDRT